MNIVLKILMERDCMTQEEAETYLDEVREELLASDSFEADEIIRNMLGLEPDYILDIFS